MDLAADLRDKIAVSVNSPKDDSVRVGDVEIAT
jgi:hypothetical protein